MTLLDDVKKICDRLSTKGWKELLLQHELNITAPNLEEELLKELPKINRNLSGFEDFSLEGIRGIEPGMPSRSLLYHALASPNVVEGLSEFPTLEELEIVENYVYGIKPPTLEHLRSRAGDSSLAIVVFATEYRSSSDTVHKKHADVCFSRTGVARVGTAPLKYTGSIRGFLPFVDQKPHSFRVLPAKYSVYIAAQRWGNKEQFGPMRFNIGERGDDRKLRFWVPLHKLFNGAECIHNMDINVKFSSRHVNEKLMRIHTELGKKSDTGWTIPNILDKPFRFTDGIAELSSDPELGTGVLVPTVHATLVERAIYENKPLTFKVPVEKAMLSSSLEITAVKDARRAPEYVHIRHLLTPEGEIQDLNKKSNLMEIIKNGDYEAVHYIDFTGDGWIQAECPELATAFPGNHPAYSLVTAPDFFPSCDQRELMDWWEQSVPHYLKEKLWKVEPKPLSDSRIAANVKTEPGIFSIEDVTMTAIVSPFYETSPMRSNIMPTREEARHSFLPDAASGEFQPGWDVSTDRDDQGLKFLTAYGLGSPFPEDAKLCAALSTFWPAVAPDIARSLEPHKDWPTVSPMTDEEIGQEGSLSWDGLQGPKEIQDKNVVQYVNWDYADYTNQALNNQFSLALTGMVTVNEYQERVLFMAYAYHALGIHDSEFRGSWSVLSFRKVDVDDAELLTAQEQSGIILSGPKYRFVMYRYENKIPDEKDFTKTLVKIEEKAVLFVSGSHVLINQVNGNWIAHTLPTHE
ncbi:hypothetical protein [Paenibacillus sp. DR312]|uniref:hypothetical protein n=1 Tax=Paenibacillus sp. DR312 TaxID=2871175 RepID=UPI001C93FCBF|nr:hypothetical protein [Paenibacillus sp. DR312]QZN77667.1 hypothetical protein K5K90_11030 [Paenibacillus sp. DR312]